MDSSFWAGEALEALEKLQTARSEERIGEPSSEDESLDLWIQHGIDACQEIIG